MFSYTATETSLIIPYKGRSQKGRNGHPDPLEPDSFFSNPKDFSTAEHLSLGGYKVCQLSMEQVTFFICDQPITMSGQPSLELWPTG